ncbi:MAG TPA: ABC transporter ATP-binding protein [Candidatus Latescibacteria bacterium]|nr:ABC transporter ATP-binding protein [Candidatus Handelsmanbacteria bacterium]HIL09314.1 ABC transporter ATP-binding protein [Candidatus Latescibacterota bacterium]
MTADLVIARDIDKRFSSGVEALRGVNLSIERGQFVSIVGPSGCGKSTFLRLVAGLDEPTGGTLTVDGRTPKDARREQLDLAFIFQDATLLPWRSVARNVGLPLELREQTDADRVAQVIDMVGLAEFADAYPAQLSGGMRMRASIARALATSPELLLLDEPFGALDEITRQRLNEELLRLWQEDRWTGLFITHNVYEAVFLSQRVLVMSARPGQLIADIAIPFDHPRDPNLRSTPEFVLLAETISHQLGEAGA